MTTFVVLRFPLCLSYLFAVLRITSGTSGAESARPATTDLPLPLLVMLPPELLQELVFDA